MTVSSGFWRPSFRHVKQSSFNEILVENCDGSSSNGKQQQTTLMKGQCKGGYGYDNDLCTTGYVGPLCQ